MKKRKTQALDDRRCRYRKPQRVRDPLFEDDPFFDPEDLVQVKYEMLRRTRIDGQSVSEASDRFGFSRPAFYEARRRLEEEGLAGLLPRRPGPKQAHKLSEEVVDFLDGVLAEDPDLKSDALVEQVEQQFGLRVHPRSVERALARRRKKNFSPRGVR